MPFSSDAVTVTFVFTFLKRKFSCELFLMIINLFFSYGVVFVRSDIRSAAHSSDGKDSDFESHHSVRVKRTLPEDIIKQNGIQQNNG